jgi:2-oxoglutarate ferredoxin oxidoreductase subunit beta
MSEIIATIEGASYVERVALNSPSGVRKAKKAVLQALDIQDRKKGFSFVEFLSTCPTNWGLDPVASLEWVNTNMIPYYPLGNFKSKED